MKVQEKFNYANVVATLALIVAVGTGGAYAASQIGSSQIKNNSIRSKDLKNRKAVRGRDVVRNSLRGSEVNERRLRASQFAPLASDAGGGCDPADASFVGCASTTIRLPGRGRLMITATGDYFSEGGATSLDCRIAVDGENESGGTSVGEEAVDNTSGGATQGFTRTRVTGRLAPGQHEIALRCAQAIPGDGRLANSSVAVLGVSG